MTILLVDDEVYTLELVSRKLQACGYTVLQAETLVEARILCARIERIDVVVSDIHMPDGDGLEFMKWVAEVLPESRRIILSAHTYERSLLQALENGRIHGMLNKPVNMDALLSEFKTG